MITLNLITDKIKKELRREKIFSIIHDILLIFLFTVTINSIFIFISYRILEDNFKKIQAQRDLISMTNQPFNMEVADINRRMQKIRNIQNEYTKWSDILYEINNLIPTGIKIEQMQLNSEANTFNITGTAILRANFLILKENLEKSKLFTEIQSPLSNLLRDHDIQFSLNAKLNKNE
ncbi:MAG: hypothetical protein ABIF17_02020 [Patescibacteria group bacterium]